MMLTASTSILLDMVSKLDSPDVALVHQMPFTTDQPGFAHAVEKVTFCQFGHHLIAGSCNVQDYDMME